MKVMLIKNLLYYFYQHYFLFLYSIKSCRIVAA